VHIPEWEWVLRLLVAGLLGAAIGAERKVHYKDAGLRTHFVVSIASALIMIVSKYGFFDLVNVHSMSIDPSRIAAQVVSGIGFLGAGLIIFRRNAITGLTTAAGIWATAGIGLAVGSGLYLISVAATAFVLIGLVALKKLEQRLVKQLDTITVTARQSEGVIARVRSVLVSAGVSIERVGVSVLEEHPNLMELEFSCRFRPDLDAGRVTDSLIQIEGVQAVDFASSRAAE
jgi:putative Mg2+ transporter-C (MgtC) family protein